MHMTKLASLLLIATFSLANDTTPATETNMQSNNGQANSSADAGQVAPDAHENVAPNNVDNSNMNSGGTMLHPNGLSMNHGGMTKDEMHKNTMYKGGRCPDVNREAETEDSINNDAETKANGTAQ